MAAVLCLSPSVTHVEAFAGDRQTGDQSRRSFVGVQGDRWWRRQSIEVVSRQRPVMPSSSKVLRSWRGKRQTRLLRSLLAGDYQREVDDHHQTLSYKQFYT
ncbi:unnamed protein product [Lactuca virosa]|uniref:Secreted protein n=1 Tax=Lactuca virosa TaxID=75947 RepID=A0AAU9LSW8_9ASTR|nr:unnamed protein product [Lactuca virosa]